MAPLPAQTERELTPHERRMQGGDTYEHQRRLASGEYVPPTVSLPEFELELDNNPDFAVNLPIPTVQFDVPIAPRRADPYLASARAQIGDEWNDAITAASRSGVDDQFADTFNEMLDIALTPTTEAVDSQPYQLEQAFGMLRIPQGLASAYRSLETTTNSIVEAISHPGEALLGAGKTILNIVPETLELFGRSQLQQERSSALIADALAGTHSAEFYEQAQQSFELPKFSFDNPAQAGGALFFEAGSLFFGGEFVEASRVSRLGRLAPELDEIELARKISFDPSLGKVDRYFGKQAGEIIAADPTARAYYTRLQAQGTDIRFINDGSLEAMGEFDGYLNRVTVDISEHASAQEVVSTLVHEATHQSRFFRGTRLGTQYEEYVAFRNEALFNFGRRPTLLERQVIWKDVQALYPELPAGRVPFGGQR